MTKLQYPLCGPQVCLQRAACLTCLVYAAFGIHQSHSCLCLIRIEAGKLAQTGFEDTS